MIAQQCKVEVRFDPKASTAYITAQREIVLPAVPANDPKATALTLGFLVHEAAHARFTDFEVGKGAPPAQDKLHQIIEDLRLETVCESAKCPNRTECWSQKTATFMILGNVCTRPCGFCSIPKGKTEALELDEPERLEALRARAQALHLPFLAISAAAGTGVPALLEAAWPHVAAARAAEAAKLLAEAADDDGAGDDAPGEGHAD